MSMNRPLTIALPVPKTWATPTNNYFGTLAALGARGVAVDAGADPSGFDGLLLPGGGDLNPALYHRPNRGSDPADDELEQLQMAALDAFVKRLAEEGIGVIIISDDLPEILDNCNRAIIMKRGRLAGEFETAEMEEARLADILAEANDEGGAA